MDSSSIPTCRTFDRWCEPHRRLPSAPSGAGSYRTARLSWYHQPCVTQGNPQVSVCLRLRCLVVSEANRARAVLNDHDAAPATFVLDDGRAIHGWAVFIRELGFRDTRSEVRGKFWYHWNPEDGLGDVISAGTIQCGERVLRVTTLSGDHPLTTEPSLARIDFIDARHLRG